jgi:hypothetical protein
MMAIRPTLRNFMVKKRVGFRALVHGPRNDDFLARMAASSDNGHSAGFEELYGDR